MTMFSPTTTPAPLGGTTKPKTLNSSPPVPVPPGGDPDGGGLDNPVVPTPLPKPDWGGKDGGKGPLLPPPPTTPTAPTTPPVTTTPVPQAPPPNQFPQGMPNAGGVPVGLDFMRQVTPNELVNNQLNNLLASNSKYMKNAALRGMETAASRGNINSSIAAGSAQRAALEAAMPIAQADAQVYRDANQGNFESLAELRKIRVTGELQNWMDSESYNREFNGRLAMLPITSAADMLTYITQRAMEDPSVYTPEVISGLNNFFNLNFNDIMSRLLNPSGGG